jgi:hypothetical protein
MAVEIARIESDFCIYAHADDSDDNSYGLMQINMKGSTGDDRRREFHIQNEDLYNPDINMRVAYEIWKKSPNPNSFDGSAKWSTSAASAHAILDANNGASPGQTAPPPNSLTDQEKADSQSGVDKLIADGTIPAGSSVSVLRTILPTLKAGDHGLTQAEIDAMKRMLEVLDALDTEAHSGPFPSIDIGSWTDALKKFLGVITSGEFWKRVGLGALAFFVILAAVLYISKNDIERMI